MKLITADVLTAYVLVLMGWTFGVIGLLTIILIDVGLLPVERYMGIFVIQATLLTFITVWLTIILYREHVTREED
ncbi:MAG: hypothetical protein BV459_08850 [Thermoplasmata archaeon M11B2D]|nr:MAG: hypothetical protein BV459_08850 [Thermoplasmata archaeon M11B2D]